jgi:enolase
MVKIIQEKLGKIIEEKYGFVEKGDEGGYALPTNDIREPLVILSRVVSDCGFQEKVSFALDVAATSFYDKDKSLYNIADKSYSKEELFTLYLLLNKEFNFISIEDPFFEEDFESFTALQKAIPNTMIIGDDLTVTNIDRVKKAIDGKSIKGLIIKPNQIGTLTETIETILYAQNNGVHCIVSHRSGETMDDMIADITVAFNCFGMKSGARGPKEREIKYSRLVKIILNK